MRKLAALFMIPVLVLLAASTASAFVFHHWGGIQGTYAMTATGNCLWAPGGFLPNFFSPSAYSSHFTAQGIWIFEANGTGKAEVTQFGISAPPIVGAPATAGSAASVKYSFDFQYAMTYDGKINVWPENLTATFLTGPKAGFKYTLEPAAPIGIEVKPEPIQYFGMVSKEWDHKTLTLNSGNGLQLYTFTKPTGDFDGTCYGICNSSRVLIRVGF